ncbi:hypothetical protein Hypma_011193 [Hypsizygus marmoreus]|uniref:Uncharacterized protein n=1 Tax=Hypsizygus marmoreus TaxID=39966 RepID=A0A369JPL4_HYPMA|nr:hypothetical protein Hypma_011193 [Hypsizygus marmoreus]
MVSLTTTIDLGGVTATTSRTQQTVTEVVTPTPIDVPLTITVTVTGTSAGAGPSGGPLTSAAEQVVKLQVAMAIVSVCMVGLGGWVAGL